MHRASISIKAGLGLLIVVLGCGGTFPLAPSGEPARDEINPGTQPGSITAAWANSGEDKVAREELRAKVPGAPGVLNRTWDGNRIRIFAARNEVVAFNLVLEASGGPAEEVRVVFDRLEGPGGLQIQSAAAKGDGIFNWTERPIENFLVRYLEIRGLSRLSYERYDERHIPHRFRRPWTGEGTGKGTWQDRPDHNRHYPDIAVPLELAPTFGIGAGHSQSIWNDIYVSKELPPGTYKGAVKVYEKDQLSHFLPVELTVKNFTLPDMPHSKAMGFLGNDLNLRYTGQGWPDLRTPEGNVARLVRDRHFQLAHRHRLDLIDNDSGTTARRADQPSAEWLPRLNGELFTAKHGYAGPGAGKGNSIYSVGTYGTWSWKDGTEQDMHQHTDRWENWFTANFPSTERFLYLIDESSDLARTQRWAQWATSNPGPGKNLLSFATVPLPSAQASIPALGITASWFTVGDTQTWQDAVTAQINNPAKRYYQYNGKRPSQGSFAIEDDGVALRELAWAQYKKKVQRWFFWETTYYNDNQGGRKQTDVFDTAATFSGPLSMDPLMGETGWNHSNGDGLLFYPGTDKIYPARNYGVKGPLASLRLKHWRRGIQDVDYLELARAIDPAAVERIVARMVPKAMWDYGIANPKDPTYIRTDISWSINPDDWEAARAELAAIIERGA